MAPPRVSILSPTYNHAAYLGDCLQSALDQSYGDWEMIVVDDGSTDGTADVAARYRDPRIAFVRQEHGGPNRLGETYNRALARSRGTLVTTLEGDDTWPSDRLARQLPVFEDDRVVLSHGTVEILEDHQRRKAESRFHDPIRNNDPVGSSLAAFLVGCNPVWSQGVMVRRAALDRIGGFVQPPGLFLVDYPTWMEVARLGRFRYLEGAPLGTWRRHGASITTNYLMNLHREFARSAERFARAHGAELDRFPVPMRLLRRSLGVYSYLGLAQLALERGEFAEARRAFVETLRRRAVLNRAARLHGLLGLFSALIHHDCRPTIQRVRRLLRGTPPPPPTIIEPIAVPW